MVLFHTLIVAFGFGIGINPPIDIHVPTSEEVALEIEMETKIEEDD